MQELMKLVSQKTGLPEDKSKDAVETVLGYLKKKLPAPISGQIDNLLGDTGTFEDIAKGLEGFLGQK
jgi:hypothetical protein